MNMFDLSIIIINYNTRELTLDCIKSVKEFTKDIRYEIILIENSTKNEEVIKSFKGIKIVRNKINNGFSGANNQGIKLAKGKYVLFLNSDTLLVENSLDKMVEWMNSHPKVGVVSPTLLYKNNELQTNGGGFPTLFK